jgi:DNA-binding response OmpR family regulator
MELGRNTEQSHLKVAGAKYPGIQLASEKGLHIAERALAPGGAEASSRPMSEDGMASKQQLNVLVVDHDEGSNVQIKDVLTSGGYQAEVLNDPEQVIEAVKQGRYQMVILDVSPPEGRGIELLERIRNTDSDICVIAMTGLPTVEAAVRTLKNQAFDYLQKPLEVDELRAVVQSAIREKGLLVDLETRLNQVVGKRLRERRSAEQLTLKQLANRTGLSVSLISQIELGKSAASMSTLHKLATALQVRMTYFFETV